MSIGRTFKEAFNKALRSLEIDSYGLETTLSGKELSPDQFEDALREPSAQRLWYIADALRSGMSVEEVYLKSKIDPWFLQNIVEILECEERLKGAKTDLSSPANLTELSTDLLRRSKEMGFSDV